MKFAVTGQNPKGDPTAITIEAVDELEALLDALHKHNISNAHAEPIEEHAGVHTVSGSADRSELPAFGMIDRWAADNASDRSILDHDASTPEPEDTSRRLTELQSEIDSLEALTKQLRDQVRAMELQLETSPSYIRSVAKAEAARGKWLRRIVLLLAFLGVLALSPSMPEIMKKAQMLIEAATGGRLNLGNAVS